MGREGLGRLRVVRTVESGVCVCSISSSGARYVRPLPPRCTPLLTESSRQRRDRLTSASELFCSSSCTRSSASRATASSIRDLDAFMSRNEFIMSTLQRKFSWVSLVHAIHRRWSLRRVTNECGVRVCADARCLLAVQLRPASLPLERSPPISTQWPLYELIVTRASTSNRGPPHNQTGVISAHSPRVHRPMQHCAARCASACKQRRYKQFSPQPPHSKLH